jgi:hypothetical protein
MSFFTFSILRRYPTANFSLNYEIKVFPQFDGYPLKRGTLFWLECGDEVKGKKKQNWKRKADQRTPKRQATLMHLSDKISTCNIL